jgi:hypothetical protein
MSEIKNNFSELTNQGTICCICLENNDLTSIQLNCRCKAIMHKKCIEEMRKNNIKKCPLCSDTVEAKKLSKSIIYILSKLVLTLFMVIMLFTYLVNILYILPSVIFFPSIFKYCDNIYNKCEYYKVNGILINNTISIEVKNFIPEYNLISTYKYNKNETCINMDYHKYTSYKQIQIVKEKTININKDIFVSYLDKSKCVDNYKYYNPPILYTKFFGIAHLICVCSFILFVKLQNYIIENNYNIIFKSLSFIFIIVCGINLVIVTFISAYYIIL